MTEQKAIEEFNLLKKTRIFIPRNDTLDVAINALEKQIPKEPFDKNGYQHCPICGFFIFSKYCMNCGQAIKWE